jgi:HSP20 family molecular chaperone IbpA
MRVVTLSRSSSVLITLHAIRAIRPLEVSCSESRPAMEGRRLAADLAAAGVRVTFYGDAALAHALHDAEAVLVGADAVASSWFLNKSGTKMLAAAATHHGVPVYVAATRDKFVDEKLAGRLQERTHDPKEVWDSAPEGVQVHNCYFEATPLELVTAVITRHWRTRDGNDARRNAHAHVRSRDPLRGAQRALASSLGPSATAAGREHFSPVARCQAPSPSRLREQRPLRFAGNIRRVAQFSFIPSGEARELSEDVPRAVRGSRRPTLPHELRAHSGEWHPTLDVVETDEAVEVLVDVSGVPAGAIRVLFRAGVLLVAGEKASRGPPKTRRFITSSASSAASPAPFAWTGRSISHARGDDCRR